MIQAVAEILDQEQVSPLAVVSKVAAYIAVTLYLSAVAIGATITLCAGRTVQLLPFVLLARSSARRPAFVSERELSDGL